MKQKISIPSIYPVACHTDNIGPGSTFVAIKGAKFDGVQFIKLAIEKRATRIVIQQGMQIPEDAQLLIEKKNIQVLAVLNSRAALAKLSAEALGYPSRSLRIIAITGTKGKTTVSFILEHILRRAGYKTALLGTIKNRILGQDFPMSLTTSQPDYLHVFFDICRQQHIDFVVMEVAAQATTFSRIDGIEFDGVIFTNFSLEHSEDYKTLDDYFAAKVKILEHCKPNMPVILNSDDKRVLNLVQHYSNTITFGIDNISDIQGKVLKNDYSGISMKIGPGDNSPSSPKGYAGHSQIEAPNLLGLFNCSNILAAIAYAQSLNITAQVIKEALFDFSGVPGRLERFMLDNGALGIIDYAHNPSSMEAVLSTLKTIKSHLIVVFGAGGDRARDKRPLMGEIAARLADIVILTTDNPRSENPERILADILAGIDKKFMSKVVIELDREIAIKKAYSLSDKNSIIALLGKGPDEYQLINGVKIPFREAQILATFQKHVN